MRIFVGLFIGILVTVAIAAIAVVTLALGMWEIDALSQALGPEPDTSVRVSSESHPDDNDNDDEKHELLDVDRIQSTEADRGMLSTIVPSPRTIVFQEADESVQLELTGVYSDGSEETLPDLETKASFSSSEPDVVQVDAGGLVTSVSPGGADIVIQYEDFRAQVPIIVYGPIVEIPPFDPDKVVQIEDGPEVVVNRIVVVPQTEKYNAELTEAIASEYGGAIIAEFKNLNLFSLEFDIGTLDALEMKLEELEADARIESATPNFLFATAQTPTSQNSPTPTPTPAPAHAYTSIGLDQTWINLANLQGKNQDALKPVHIAVMDYGFINCQSPNSNDDYCKALGKHQFETQFKRNNDLHGAAVAIVIRRVISGDATRSFNGSFLPGLDATLHLYDVGTDLGDIRSALEDILSAFDRMNPHNDKIDVINMSFAAHCHIKIVICLDFADDIFKMREGGRIENTIEDIEAKKRPVLVIAAGNNGKDAKNTFPAHLSTSFDNVITVGGLGKSNQDRAADSNYGKEIITIAAPYSVWATTEEDGTSFSAPLVTGVVALMRAVNPNLAHWQIKRILEDTGVTIPVEIPEGKEQWKRVDACEAVSKAYEMGHYAPSLRTPTPGNPLPLPPPTCSPPPPPTAIVTPTPEPAFARLEPNPETVDFSPGKFHTFTVKTNLPEGALVMLSTDFVTGLQPRVIDAWHLEDTAPDRSVCPAEKNQRKLMKNDSVLHLEACAYAPSSITLWDPKSLRRSRSEARLLKEYIITVQPPEPEPVPSKIKNLTCRVRVFGGGSFSMSLAWDNPPREENVTLYRITYESPTRTKSFSDAVRSYTSIYEIAPNTTYTFSVTPYGLGGQGEISDSVSCTTPMLTPTPTPAAISTPTPEPTATPISTNSLPVTPIPSCIKPLPLVREVEGNFQECLQNYFTFKLDKTTHVRFRLAAIAHFSAPWLTLDKGNPPHGLSTAYVGSETQCSERELNLLGPNAELIGHCEIIGISLPPGEYSIMVIMDSESYERTLSYLGDANRHFRFRVSHNLAP